MTHKTSARLLLNLLAATFLVGTLAGQAQAETVWRFPPKGGAPYDVHQSTYPLSVESDCRDRGVVAMEAEWARVSL